MTLRCIYCGRTLKAAAAWTLGKPIGPKCARESGRKVRAVRQSKSDAPVAADSRQLPLELQA